MYTKRKVIVKMLGMFILALILGACGGAQDASRAYSRGMINRGAIVPAENIRVHEYLNYYEQRFPVPVGDSMGLDLRLGNTTIPPSGGEVWLQIGIQAREAEDHIRTPLNLALVLDASGSMDAPDKMPYLKQSLLVFLQTLEPEDIVSIVAYDTDAQLIYPASFVGEKMWIEEAVHRIQPGAMTNLHAGMMLGFDQVDRNFDIRRNNRVLLLTDGIANVGKVDPRQIAEDALSYNEKGIYLSTIGLGSDMNDALLSTLAQQGNGAYHFIDSAQEMDKVFRKEADGLVERVANDVRIQIKPSPMFDLVEVTGYEGAPPYEGVEIQMQPMGAGDSQVLMAKLIGSDGLFGVEDVAEVTLVYEDAFGQRTQHIGQSAQVMVANQAVYKPVSDAEVQRNVTIVRSAQALQAIDQLYLGGEYLAAWYLAHDMEFDLRNTARITGDQQMIDDADLFNRYQLTLANALGYDPEFRGPDPTRPPGYDEQPQRWDPAELPTIGLDG
jgi:Ca-activated chloride channel family protein